MVGNLRKSCFSGVIGRKPAAGFVEEEASGEEAEAAAAIFCSESAYEKEHTAE